MGRAVARHHFPPLLACIVVGLCLGAALLSGYLDSLAPVALLGAVPVMVYLLVHPRAVVVLMMFVWAGPLDRQLLTRSVGGLNISVGTVLLGIGLAWVVMSRLMGRPPRRALRGHWFWIPFALYWAAMVHGLVLAYSAGDSRGVVANTALACCAGLVYFVARDAYADDPEALARHMVIVTGVSAVAVVVGVLTGLQNLFGPQIGYVITAGQVSETVRIDPPLLRLLSITILMLGPGRILSTGPMRRLRWPLLTAMVLAEALSLTRSTWLPLILAAMLIPVVAARRGRITLLARNVAVVVLLLTAGLGAAVGGVAGDQGRVVAERLLSVADDGVTVDDSYRDRARENEAALRKIREHPVAGIGIPRQYGAYVSMIDPRDENFLLYDQRRFIHQSYLGLWMWLGLPGMIAMTSLSAGVLILAWHVLRQTRVSRAGPVAALAGLTALAISSTFQTNLLYQPAHLALGMGLAYVETWVRWHRRFPSGSADLEDCSPRVGVAGRERPPRAYRVDGLTTTR